VGQPGRHVPGPHQFGAPA